MNARCEQFFRTDARYYTAKGIEVCPRWRRGTPNAFLNFLEDMGERPAGTSLGRLDADGDYCPENCAWQTGSEQGLSQPSFRGKEITVDGVTQTYEEWAGHLGISYLSFLKRLSRGWTEEEACVVPRNRVRRVVLRERAKIC